MSRRTLPVPGLVPGLVTALVPGLLALLPPSAALHAQEPGLKLAVGDVGLGLGDVPRLDGLRINFRDRHLERVRGMNLTLWSPYDENEGRVAGLAVGLPLTGAAAMDGLALGAGVAVERRFRGVAVAPVGFGSGEGVQGIAVGGIGIGTGGPMKGIMVGGVGVGAGEDVEGLLLGGVGVGSGGDVRGIAVGGVGLGLQGDLTGIAVGGVGVGAGQDVRGIVVGGVGAGAGGDVLGLAVGGIGVGAGGEIRGVALAGVGVGAPRMTGLVSALAAGGREVRGVVIAPAYFTIEEEGALHGVQVGLINIARNKPSFRVLPLVNHHP